MRIWSNGDWVGWLIVAWTVLVAGALIFLEVSIFLSPDDGWVPNVSLELFAIILALGVWMLGVFAGIILWLIAAFLRDLIREREAFARDESKASGRKSICKRCDRTQATGMRRRLSGASRRLAPGVHPYAQGIARREIPARSTRKCLLRALRFAITRSRELVHWKSVR